jgi:hypothetical protein
MKSWISHAAILRFTGSMKRLLLFLLVVASAHADPTVAPTVGVLILTSATGNDPVSISFSNIGFGVIGNGVVTDANGTKTTFDNRDIGKIVYLDENYYTVLHRDAYFLQNASGLRSREMFVNTTFQHIASDQDQKAIQASRDVLANVITDYPQSKDQLQPQVDLLNADLDRYAQHQEFINGQWLTPEQVAQQAPPPVDDSGHVSFVTKDGKSYGHVTVFVTDDGLSVLSSSGGTTIPFVLLPKDLSVFSPDVQSEVKAALAKEAPPTPPPAPVVQSAPPPPSPSLFSKAASWFWSAVDQVKSWTGMSGSDTVTKTAETVVPTVAHPDAGSSIVIIRGDVAQGTGFLVHTPSGPVVMTNLHVIFANPNLRITTNTGAQIQVLSLKGATDRDLAMFLIQDNKYDYLDLADASNSVNEAVITPGNSEGGQVILNTQGKVLGVGADRVEISNPIFHGNSGGPIIDVTSGKVLGVVTEASNVEPSDAVDKASLANPASAITGPMRYFGMRADNVPQWEPYDMDVFLQESTLLKNFHENSRCLDSLLNGKAYEQANLITYGAPDSKYYLRNTTISQLAARYDPIPTGLDSGEKAEMVREFFLDLENFANMDVASMQHPSNFYSFEGQSCGKEMAYRLALKKELAKMQDKVGETPASADPMTGPPGL